MYWPPSYGGNRAPSRETTRKRDRLCESLRHSTIRPDFISAIVSSGLLELELEEGDGREGRLQMCFPCVREAQLAQHPDRGCVSLRHERDDPRSPQDASDEIQDRRSRFERKPLRPEFGEEGVPEIDVEESFALEHTAHPDRLQRGLELDQIEPVPMPLVAGDRSFEQVAG